VITIPFRDFHILKILELYGSSKKPLDLVFNHYFRANKAIGSKDKKEISETIYGMVRWLGLIDHSIKGAISWESRLSTFRSIKIEEKILDESLPPHIRVSFPKGLYEMLEDAYGESKAIELCLNCNSLAPATVRVNPLKISRDALFEQWKGTYDISKTAVSPFGIIFNKRINYFQLPEFKQGYFEVQDEASQLLAQMIQAKPQDQVLDYCAGSGGKTLAFAHLLQETGQIYLHDIRPSALVEARRRLARAGIQNGQTPKKLSHLKRKMDWVLVDAPCSGSGTYRRNPDMKWRFEPLELKKLVIEQQIIFENALEYVKPGGSIVYATCSMLPVENQEQVNVFLDQYPLELQAPPFQTLPVVGGMDGFFGAWFCLKQDCDKTARPL
jgi:16S rRNA C967 or C1407 C5-methylase (RsmB/RsmF family)